MFLKGIGTYIIVLLIGGLIGFFVSTAYSSPSPVDNTHLQEERALGYKFISPLLECDLGSPSTLNGLNSLKLKLERYIDDKKSSNTITSAAVYFRDLNNGEWIGVNEHADYAPASLLKLPVMMAYFKKAEENSSLLSKKLPLDTDIQVLQQELSKPTVKENKEYTVEELLHKMITQSDNESLITLVKNIDGDAIDKITRDLGVETFGENIPENFMSVKGYASLFRILYNASYLSKTYSEKSLSILSQSEFKDGIVAGVPSHIIVAHKYGERESNQGKQLHDCGIVYYPGQPYLLCIMTQGGNLTTQSHIISDISRQTYEEIRDRSSKERNQ